MKTRTKRLSIDIASELWRDLKIEALDREIPLTALVSEKLSSPAGTPKKKERQRERDVDPGVLRARAFARKER